VTDAPTPGTADWAAPSRLTRVDEQQTSNEWVPKYWESADASALVVDDERRFAVNTARDQLRFTLPEGAYDPERHFLLGFVDGAPRFVLAGELPPETETAATLREVATALDDTERDLAITAVAVLNWHRNEPFCARCGTATQVRKAGFMRVCPHCGNEYFPRTDPAVIVAIVDTDDRLLLGRQTTWGKRVSVFAGFVEAGESAEQAVHREMSEEVGLRLDDVRYFGSQPWPFPRSLMLGFVARAAGAEFGIDGAEISYADWFTRERVEREVADGTIELPTSTSIAHRLVTAWRQNRL
jgi:NAD+ diphosphatase